jgi:hypothetical protein
VTNLLEALSWWPWHPDRRIFGVRSAPRAPGQVTVAWATREPRPTVLLQHDGTEIFRDEQLRIEHEVTVVGWIGVRQDLVIDVGDESRVVAVDF